VTGETIESSFAYLAQTDFSFACEHGDGLKEWTDRVRQWEIADEGGAPVFNGAVRCAVSLALVDLIGKTYGVSARDIIYAAGEGGSYRKRLRRVRYSIICSAGSWYSLVARLVAFRLYGFKAVKLKVGWGREQDERLVSIARAVLGRGVDIRVDANGVWDFDSALSTIPRFEQYGVSCVEEPLAPDARGRLAELRRVVGIPIMLDESVCSYRQIREAVGNNACDMANIRLSKCGGLFSALRLVDYCRRKGIRFQLGCQVGETGILSAAGRHFALEVPDLTYLEGSYDRYLLRGNSTSRHVRFGYGGWGGELSGTGLGVAVERPLLERYAVAVKTIR
jgi:muconate cycloisomerase